MSIASVTPLVSRAGTSRNVYSASRVTRGALARVVAEPSGEPTLIQGNPAEHPLAQVCKISDAPSVRQRAARLKGEDPHEHRRPHSPRRVAVSVPDSAAAHLAGVARRVIRAVQQLHVSKLLMVVGYALVMCAAVYIGLSLQGTYEGQTIVHSVQAGESVWSLAAEVAGERPLQDVVADIYRLNDLSGGLKYGQQIVLPVQ